MNIKTTHDHYMDAQREAALAGVDISDIVQSKKIETYKSRTNQIRQRISKALFKPEEKETNKGEPVASSSIASTSEGRNKFLSEFKNTLNKERNQ